MKKHLSEEKRMLSVIGEYDVLVCGGGVAGCAAAIAAARNGMNVGLIEKGYNLGGLATSGLICFFLPLCDGLGNQIIKGIAEEFFLMSIELGPGKIPECWKNNEVADRQKERLTAEFNPFWFMLLLERMVIEAGVHIMYDTRLCASICENDAIKGIIVENKSGRCAIECKTAIDATGDADLSFMCGEDTVSLDSNRSAAWYYSLWNGNPKINILGDIFFEPVPEGHRTFAGDNWEDVTAFCVDSKTIIREHIIKHQPVSGVSQNIPIALPSIPLMRKTRRLKGLYEISENDENRYCPTAVGMTGYYRKKGLKIYFPYECLIGKTRNLFVAGKCISSKEEFAWNITRGIPSCSITGQAAGTAASICVKNNIDATSMDILELQSNLLNQGVIIDHSYVIDSPDKP